MALFGEDDDTPAEEADPPELEEEPGPDPSEGTEEAEADEASDERLDASEGAPEAEDQEDEQASGPAEGGDEGPGDDIDVEEALKDLSARMSVLSSNLEGVQETRGELEDKIGDVEDRMSRLGSLAEAVSSEYNPFVSENAPAEPSWTPEREDPEAGQDPASGPSPDPADEAPPDPEAPNEPATTPEPTEPEGPSPASPDETPEDDAGPNRIPRTDPENLEPSNDGHEDTQPQAAPNPMPGAAGRDGEEPDEFEENLILLEWVGMMLDRVGRAGLMDLLDYYQNLGWLDRDTKDQATRVAVGVDAPDRVGDGHWRGDVELHRRSLVAIQRLQGDEIPAARLDELELDLRRLFRE